MTIAGQVPRILIIDDEAASVAELRTILTGMGDILSAQNGKAGIAAVREQSPDLVLLDTEMPDIDGFDVCARLKADPATADIPIIFVTLQRGVEHETQALDLGAVDFILKPVNPAVLRVRVRTHLTLKFQNDVLRERASTDHLTGLPNRRSFDIAVEQEWRRARRSKEPLALALIDICSDPIT